MQYGAQLPKHGRVVAGEVEQQERLQRLYAGGDVHEEVAALWRLACPRLVVVVRGTGDTVHQKSMYNSQSTAQAAGY